jgi:hypothetical protein
VTQHYALSDSVSASLADTRSVRRLGGFVLVAHPEAIFSRSAVGASALQRQGQGLPPLSEPFVNNNHAAVCELFTESGSSEFFSNRKLMSAVFKRRGTICK